jgi:hypothetical protein
MHERFEHLPRQEPRRLDKLLPSQRVMVRPVQIHTLAGARHRHIEQPLLSSDLAHSDRVAQRPLLHTGCRATRRGYLGLGTLARRAGL